MRKFCYFFVILFYAGTAYGADPLPSWNNTDTKSAIVAYVTAVTTQGSARFVSVPRRIAVFDIDGTLMLEKPVFLQGLFLESLVKQKVIENPALAENPDYKALLEKKSWPEYLAHTPLESIMRLYYDTHTGMTQEEFTAMARRFLRPFYNRSIVYQPMAELLSYLRSKQFKIYLVTGSETQFVRAFSQEFFNVPPEQVIGTSWKSELKEIEKDKDVEVMRLPATNIYNDKRQKVLEIEERIGRKPIFAAGNDGNGGDIAMLRYTTQAGGFGLVVVHNDWERERAYTDKDGMTQKAAAKFGWTLARVRSDWKRLFPGYDRQATSQ